MLKVQNFNLYIDFDFNTRIIGKLNNNSLFLSDT
jgi:hypothetical protein